MSKEFWGLKEGNIWLTAHGFMTRAWQTMIMDGEKTIIEREKTFFKTKIEAETWLKANYVPYA